MARRRAATYARVSTVRQGGDDRYSLPEQEHGTRTYCEEQGYEHIVHLSEMHTGSELDERPQLTKIRNMIRRREIDVLVLMQLDRLARDQFHQAVVFYECEQHGVSVELVTEKIDDTPFGRYMLLTKGFHAEQQRRDTREKSMRGKRQRVRAGLILATHSPLYGYLWPDDRKSRYVINPEIAPIVQRIFQDVLRGLSTYEIAVALNEEGVLTPLHYQYTRKGKAPPARGAEWQDRTVYAIVTNPAYYGNYEAFKTQKVRKERENVLTGQRERYQVQTPSTEEARVSLPDVAPLIVSREAWESANAQLSHNKLTSARRNSNPDETLLRGGFIRCGLCHKKLYVAHKHYRPADGTVVDYPYYVCAGRSQVGTRHCPGVSIRADIFDKRVWEVMLEKMRNPQPIVDAARQEMDLKDASYTVQSHRGVVKRLEEQVKGFARLMAARVTETGETDEILLQQYDALHVQLRNAKKKLDGVERELEQQRDAKEQLDNLVGWCRAVTEHSAEMTYYQKRIVLRVFGFVIDLPDNTHEANPYFLMTAKRSSGAVPSIVDKYYMNSTIQPQMLLEVDDRDDWEQDLSSLTDLHSSWRIF